MRHCLTVRHYDKGDFDFRAVVAAQLQINPTDLEQLHTERSYPLLRRDDDQGTVFHQRFYAGVEESDFIRLYLRFLRQVVRPWLAGGRMVYQLVPTFRVQLPGNVAVGEPHRDRDYGHLPTGLNFWLPVTRAAGTSAIWIEHPDDSGDYRPVDVDPGQVLIFDGANLRHANAMNETGQTRVSFDFRVIPWHLYRDRPTQRTITGRRRFALGSYYGVLEP
jgi:hypothetical protein